MPVAGGADRGCAVDTIRPLMYVNGTTPTVSYHLMIKRSLRFHLPGGRHGAPVAAVALLCAVVIACGGSSEPKATPQAQARLDACALVTKAEVEAAMGVSAGEPESRQPASGRGSACVFALNTAAGRRTLQVQVEPPPAGRRYSPADISSFATAPDEPPTTVPGVGEAAYLAESRLHVLAHRLYLSVGDPQFVEGAQPLDTEGLKKIARMAVERLPR